MMECGKPLPRRGNRLALPGREPVGWRDTYGLLR